MVTEIELFEYLGLCLRGWMKRDVYRRKWIHETNYFINMTVKHNNLLNPIMGRLYLYFVGLNVSVIHMTIIRSVRANEIAM